MNREYELFYIVRPDIDEDQVRVTMDEVAALVAGHGGEMTKSSLWGRRRLAYPIAGFNDGYYALKEIGLPAEKVRELERQLRLDERVIRHLISLTQVYYLPGDEDRRGRSRTRSKDRAEAAGAPASASGEVADDVVQAEAPAPASGEVADDVVQAEVAADDGYDEAVGEAVEQSDDDAGEE
ncbi:MAG TPA: 30S ribosomal protein S6 [Candidatus Dormibacteraeota bacterium]